MRRQYSRLTRIEDRKAKRSALVYAGLTVLLIVLIIFFGFGFLSKVVALFTNLRRSSAPVEQTDKTPPPPPQFEDLPQFTNKMEIELKGKAEPGSTVKITFNAKEKEIVANSDGDFITNFPLLDGENRVKAIATDSAGNQSFETNIFTVTYDNKDPNLTIDKPSDGQSFFGKQRQISVEGTTDPENSVTVNEHVAIVNSSGKFSTTFSLADGDNELVIKAVDPAGNETEKKLSVKFTP
jgi:hypothetical protein